MSHVRAVLWALVIGGALAGAAWLSVRDASTGAPPALVEDPAAAPIPVRPDSEQPYRPYQFHLTPDQAIQVFEERVRNDPGDHLSFTQLGSLYIRKARQDGDHAAYERAEAALRRALYIVPRHVPARIGLALVACARHQFADGLRQAEEVYREAPAELEALIVIGDAQLELGNDRDAERSYRDLERQGPQPPAPALLARLARLAELRGDPDQAVRLLRQAAAGQRESHDFPEPAAWYSMRLGEVLFSQGRPEEAAGHLDAALTVHPRYPAALALLAKVRAAQGRLNEAEELYVRAVRISPDLSAVIDLGDLCAKTGNEFLAKINFDKVEQMDRDDSAYDRELALFYCNHDRRLPRALELARRDLQARQDVYAYDTLAWALFKNGHLRDAEEAVTKALKLGTRDATLFYHAGLIYEQLGNSDKARDYLSRALAVNPHFSLSQAETARQALARLGGGPATR